MPVQANVLQVWFEEIIFRKPSEWAYLLQRYHFKNMGAQVRFGTEGKKRLKVKKPKLVN